MPGLVLEGGAPVPRVADREPARCDCGDRTRPRRLRAHVRTPLIDACQIDETTGEIVPVLTIVTDNGGPFRSLNFQLFITTHPELRHVRTRVKSPGQNGSRERGFGTLKYERLLLDEISNALELVARAEDYRVEYNEIRPHEAIAWNRPLKVHLGKADPTIPNFEREEILPTT